METTDPIRRLLREVGQDRPASWRTVAYRRFTRREHEKGLSAGWRLHAGWFRRASGLEWGWFVQESDDG